MSAFEVLPIEDRELFLRYAVPCGQVLVKRGDLREEVLDHLSESVSQGRRIDVPVENIFKVASRMCTIIAKRMGKDSIDAEVIRKYFLREHDKAIEWRRRIKPDINVRDCSVKAGKIKRIADGSAVVKTKMGELVCKTDFDRKLRESDWVSVHYDYIGEKLKRHYLNRML